LTAKFLKDLKEIQGKFVVEQEFLKMEVEDRDRRIETIVNERDILKKQVEEMQMQQPVEVKVSVDGVPLEILEGARMSKPTSKRKTTEVRRKTTKKKPIKRKN
jgi:hypothetical protein